MSAHPVMLKNKGLNLQFGNRLQIRMPKTTGMSRRKKGVFPINVFMGHETRMNANHVLSRKMLRDSIEQ